MIQIINSLTQKKEIFDFPRSKIIKWYTCGPTIYNNSHIGHGRTFITFDVIRRILTHYGYNIEYVMNLTNIDDSSFKSKSAPRFGQSCFLKVCLRFS